MKVNKKRKAISVAIIMQSILSAIITLTLLLALSPIHTANAISGDLESTFGSGGKLTTNIDASTIDEGNAIALQTDGKIVVAGASNDNFAVMRYASAGKLDTTFDSGGIVTTDFTNLGGALHHHRHAGRCTTIAGAPCDVRPQSRSV